MAAIFKRETKSYYTGMVGYVTAAVSLFFLGLYFTNRNLMYASSDFASVLYTTTLIMLFLLPAISMRSFAEDRRNKTDQLLLTSPVSIPGIVLGKFLAEVVVFALPLTVAAEAGLPEEEDRAAALGVTPVDLPKRKNFGVFLEA